MALSITHPTVADASFSAAGKTAWEQDHSFGGLTAGSVLFAGTDGVPTDDNAGLSFNATTDVLTVTGGVDATATFPIRIGGTAVLTVGASSITAAQPILLSAGSVGAPPLAFSAATNRGIITGAGAGGVGIVNGGVLSHDLDANGMFITSAVAYVKFNDSTLVRDAAGTLAQRNGTAAQTFRLYGTFTDASNYERGALNMGADYVELAAETAGTGDDNMDVRLTPAGTGLVRFGTHTVIGAEAVSGYITIKDSGGTSRKIAVVS